jgi:drug/metabolite transporter (DMT)-like permease
MHNTLLIALLAGFGGMFGWGFADFFAKKTIDRIGAIKSLVWAHSFGTALFIVIALAQVFLRGGSVYFPGNFGSWAGLAFFGALQMVVYWLVYEGFGKGQVAVLNPVFASYSGIVALISIAALGERLNLILAGALFAIFAGIILLNLDIEGLRSKKLKVTPGLSEVALAALLAAFWTVGWDKFIHGHDSLSYALYMYAFMTVAAFALAKIMKVKLLGVDNDLRKFLILIGLSETVAYLAISWGYSRTPLTSVVALVSGSFSLPTIILAFIFLKERITRLQLGAIFMIILGIIFVALN